MYLGKARIKDMAKYINSIEYDMEYKRDHGILDQFTEARGAYFAALRMASLAGVKSEVHEVRMQLKEEK